MDIIPIYTFGIGIIGTASVTPGYGRTQIPLFSKIPSRLGGGTNHITVDSKVDAMTVVAAVDTSERSYNVLNQAATLAERFDETVHVVHVMTRSEAINAETSSITSDDAVEISELRATAARVATDHLEDHPLSVDTEAVGLIGNPADEIVEYASQHNARYIVVSPRRRSQTGKILFGSVAQSILLNTSCPVVSVVEETDG